MPAVGPVPAILLFVAALGWFAYHHVQQTAPGRWRHIGTALLGLGAALVLWVGTTVALDARPLATGTLDAREGELVVPAHEGGVSLVVRASLPHVDEKETAQGHYTVHVQDDAGHESRYVRQFEEHWETRKVGRRGGTYEGLAVHDEERIDLVGFAPGATLRVDIAARDGDIVGPFVVEALPSPPPLRTVGWLAGLLAVAGTAFDGLVHRKTFVGFALGTLGTFACTLLANVTPHGPATVVLGAAMFAVIVGCGAAFAMRVVVMALAPHPAEPGGTAAAR